MKQEKRQPKRDKNNNPILLDKDGNPVQDPNIRLLLDKSGFPILNTLGIPIIVDNSKEPANNKDKNTKYVDTKMKRIKAKKSKRRKR